MIKKIAPILLLTTMSVITLLLSFSGIHDLHISKLWNVPVFAYGVFLVFRTFNIEVNQSSIMLTFSTFLLFLTIMTEKDLETISIACITNIFIYGIYLIDAWKQR
jgi:hypothetical protein